MGFYEKDGKRISEEDAFGDALMEDAFLDWFFRWEQGWHHYEDDDEMESIEDMTQQHINREIHYLRRA